MAPQPAVARKGASAPVLTGFDNRFRLTDRAMEMHARKVLGGLTRRPVNIGGVRPHFFVQCGDIRIVYAYIYKNACSAFKDFIIETSPHYDGSPIDSGNKVHFLIDHHLVHDEGETRPGDVRLFVYRDPFERFASGYINKFVSRSGHADVFANVHRLTGLEPGSLTAEQLARKVLVPFLQTGRAAGRTELDHHFTAQSDCLAHMNYDVAIPMRELLPAMSQLIGSELAQRFFAKPVNRSEGKVYREDVSNVSADDLHQRFRATGELPHRDALLTPAIRGLIESLYRHDFAMIRRIERKARRSAALA